MESRYPLGEPKWQLPEGTASGSALAQLTREAVEARIKQNFETMGVPWSQAVNDRWQDLFSAADGEEISKEVFRRFQEIEGRKLYASCEAAAEGHPELYVLRADLEVNVDPSEFAPGAIGDGDNVFATDDVSGTVLVVRRIEEVDRVIEEGVPEGTIALIDDAGGTMTAPILTEFAGVICLAGTVRSHLGILAREFGVPTLMAARLSRPLRSGEQVRVEYSAEPQVASAYLEEDKRRRAEIRVVGEE